MENKKKKLGISIVLLVSIALLCGCNSGPETTTTTTTQEQVKECGTTDALSQTSMSEESKIEEGDPVYCFGEAVLNDCEKAQIKSGETAQIPAIVGTLKQKDQCYVRLEFKEASGNKTQVGKKLAGKYLECKVPMEQLEKRFKQGNMTLEENPGQVGMYSLFYPLFTAGRPSSNCTGTAVEVIKQQQQQQQQP